MVKIFRGAGLGADGLAVAGAGAMAGPEKLYCFLVLAAGSEEGGSGVAEAGA